MDIITEFSHAKLYAILYQKDGLEFSLIVGGTTIAIVIVLSQGNPHPAQVRILPLEEV